MPRLSGIDEEQQCSIIGRSAEIMSKSSTVPETLHTSLTGIGSFNLLQQRANARGFQRHLNEMIRLQAAAAAACGKNGSAASSEQQQSTSIDSLPGTMQQSSLSMHAGMTYSSASDSGCMIESSSSAATTDDDQKVRTSMDDVSNMNNNYSNNLNNNINSNDNNNVNISTRKSSSGLVKPGVVLDLDISQL